jgi:hypothetical protein
MSEGNSNNISATTTKRGFLSSEMKASKQIHQEEEQQKLG